MTRKISFARQTTLFDSSEFSYQPTVCSPMNYIGGKYKLLPQILPLIPKGINVFVDLFCGGCNVGINIQAQRIIFNDNLIYLIDLYKMFRDQPKESTLSHIEQRIDEFNLSLTNSDGYNKLRKFYNESRNALDLFVLTAYSFNHQIRFNSSHEFNNPFGKERSSYNERMRQNLISFINRLKSKEIEFTTLNFDNFNFSELSVEDFVYCDPPYLITSGTYNDGKRGFTGWSENEEVKLLNILDTLNSKGIRFALSNVLHHKGTTNSILSDWLDTNEYHVHHLAKDYSNSNYHLKNKRGNFTDEVLITNYDQK